MRRQGVTKLPGFLQTGDADPGRETDASLMPETSYEGLETGKGATTEHAASRVTLWTVGQAVVMQGRYHMRACIRRNSAAQLVFSFRRRLPIQVMYILLVPLLFSIPQCLALWQQTCLCAGEEARQATPEGPVAKRRRTVTPARPGRRGAEAAPSRVGCCRHLVRSCAVGSRLLQSTAEAAVQLYVIET